MSIVGQSIHPIFVKNTSYTLTLPINYPKLVSAHAQICLLGAGDDGVHGKCGITQVVGVQSNVEDFWPPVGAIFRENVLTMNFYAEAMPGGMVCHLVIDYWS